ncbi:MAG: hypothetical protein IJR82_03565 [Bacilli bacterium]|nr:hypothetical protein [Bacilli bacterium]
MKLIGKITTYNGKYGTIITQDNELIDFDFKDISFNQNINEGDIVEFRLEIKFPNIKIARNINVISDTIIN